MRRAPSAMAAVLTAMLAGAAAWAAPGRSTTPARPRAPVKVGVVLKALDNPYFVALYEGARAEAAQLGARLTVRSVPSSDDFAGQAAQLRAALAEHDDCYVINPATQVNLLPALRGVRQPVVDVDSPIDPAAARRAGVRLRTFIGTDDVAGGEAAGARMAALLPRGGEVALIGGLFPNANSDNRLQGFTTAIGGSRLRVVARVYADYDRTKAEIATERVLRAHPHLAGVFAANDLMALGADDALRATGRSGTVRIVGYDGIPEALDAVAAGSLSATVSQYPYVMGQMAVEACAVAARGATLPARVDPPIALLGTGTIARAIAAFPRPVARYADPFARKLR